MSLKLGLRRLHDANLVPHTKTRTPEDLIRLLISFSRPPSPITWMGRYGHEAKLERHCYCRSILQWQPTPFSTTDERREETLNQTPRALLPLPGLAFRRLLVLPPFFLFFNFRRQGVG